jgi:catechol-2,3-dioxygenase
MKLEHFALNVENPIAMANWYVENFDLKIIRQQTAPPFTHFLADDSGRIMIEIYTNPSDKVPPYRNMDPLLLHIAFVSDSPENDKNRLLAHGASFDSDVHSEDGSYLVMMRDPWGLSIQLCKRGVSMLLKKEL